VVTLRDRSNRAPKNCNRYLRKSNWHPKAPKFYKKNKKHTLARAWIPGNGGGRGEDEELHLGSAGEKER
jgi:hypothetical protein